MNDNDNSEEKSTVIEIDSQGMTDEPFEQTITEEIDEDISEAEQEIEPVKENKPKNKFIAWFSWPKVSLIILTIIPTAYFYYERGRDASEYISEELTKNKLSVYSRYSIERYPNDSFSLEVVEESKECVTDKEVLQENNKYIFLVECKGAVGDLINFRVTSKNCPRIIDRGQGYLGGESEFDIRCN